MYIFALFILDLITVYLIQRTSNAMVQSFQYMYMYNAVNGVAFKATVSKCLYPIQDYSYLSIITKEG